MNTTRWIVLWMLIGIGFFTISDVRASDDYWYAAVGLGDNSNLTGASREWIDGSGIGAILEVGYVRHLKGGLHVTGRWVHLSQLDVGPPFNDQEESSVDHFGFGFEYRW